jgi:hypothetical protein
VTDIGETRPGGWILQLTCCGRDDGTYAAATWQEADEFRESYLSGSGVAGPGRSVRALMMGHDRSAIIAAGFDEGAGS